MFPRNLIQATTKNIICFNSRSFSTGLNIKTFATKAHEIATEAANKKHTPSIKTPFYRSPGAFTKTTAKYKREARRLEKITQNSAIAIQNAKENFKKLVAYTPVETTYISSQESPLAFTDDYHLKYRVLTALMKYTKITIPSSQLGPLKNVNDVVEFYKTRIQEIAEVKKAKATKQEYPSNVRLITNKSVIAKFGY